MMTNKTKGAKVPDPFAPMRQTAGVSSTVRPRAEMIR